MIETPHGKVVVKDYRTNGRFFRNIVGRVLVLREKYAYQRLGRMTGVPAFYGNMDSFSLCIAYVSGSNLEEMEKNGGPPKGFFTSLEKLIEEIHGKGLVHCDIKKAANVMSDKEGRPWLVDWAASLSKSECRIFPLNRLYHRLLVEDKKALIKFMLRSMPNAVSSAEMEEYLKRDSVEVFVRGARDIFRALLQRSCLRPRKPSSPLKP